MISPAHAATIAEAREHVAANANRRASVPADSYCAAVVALADEVQRLEREARERGRLGAGWRDHGG